MSPQSPLSLKHARTSITQESGARVETFSSIVSNPPSFESNHSSPLLMAAQWEGVRGAGVSVTASKQAYIWHISARPNIPLGCAEFR